MEVGIVRIHCCNSSNKYICVSVKDFNAKKKTERSKANALKCTGV